MGTACWRSVTGNLKRATVSAPTAFRASSSCTRRRLRISRIPWGDGGKYIGRGMGGNGFSARGTRGFAAEDHPPDSGSSWGARLNGSFHKYGNLFFLETRHATRNLRDSTDKHGPGSRNPVVHRRDAEAAEKVTTKQASLRTLRLCGEG